MAILTNLSQKHRLFVEAYDGDMPHAMRLAGFTGADAYLQTQGDQLIREPLIQEAIRERSKYQANLKSTIATREERQAFWSSIMKNEDPYAKEELDSNNVPIKAPANIPLDKRLKASELLGKSETDFVDKIDLMAQVTVSDIIMKSYDPNGTRTLEDIEATYRQLQETKVIAIRHKEDEEDEEEIPEPESPEDFI